MKRAIISLLFFSFIPFLLYFLPLGMSTGVWLPCNSTNVGSTKTMGTTTYWCCYVNGNYQWQTSPCPPPTTTTTRPPTTTTTTPPTTTTTTVPSTITLIANPSSIPADGTRQSTITATLSTPKAGVNISFTTTLGTFITPQGTPSTSSYCISDSNGSCQAYITSTQVGTATITATAQGYSSGQTSVTFTTPPSSVVVSVWPKYISPGQNLTVTVYIKSYDYVKGKDVSLSIKLDDKDWPSCVFNNKKLTEMGWSSTCDNMHWGSCGKDNSWSCDSSGCHSNYYGWPITVDSNSTEHWIRITFTYQIPSTLSPGSHTIEITPTLYSTPIRLTSASATIYVAPRTIFDPIIILIRDLLKVLLG